MALPTIHLCAFNFHTTNIRRIGNVVDGGETLSGFSDSIESDGGGYLAADFSNGSTRDARTAKQWRVLSDYTVSESLIICLCAERLTQPIGPIIRPHRDAPSAFIDPSLTSTPGAAYVTVGATALRATQMVISGVSEVALVGGELFSIQHPTWGWRAYRIRSVTQQSPSSFLITFRSPLREAVASGTAVEFDMPRCQMRKTAQTDNTMTDGRFGQCAINFREDMAPPA